MNTLNPSSSIVQINPERITDFNRTDAQLENYLLFAIAVAGKKAEPIAKKINTLVETFDGRPMNRFRSCNADEIDAIWHGLDLGPYEKMWRATLGVRNLDLRTCTIADLENVYGIGPKTSRFFILHSRPAQRQVVLDVHVLRWLRQEFGMKTPEGTPNGQRYLDLEAQACDLIAARYPDKTFAEIDLNAWITMRSKGEPRKTRKKGMR